jgi:hypothetical protein
VSFFAVFIPDGSPPVCRHFEERTELLGYLAGLPEDYAFCYVFEGRRLPLSGTVPRILVDGDEILNVQPAAPADPLAATGLDGRIGTPVDGLDDDYAGLTPSFGD